MQNYRCVNYHALPYMGVFQVHLLLQLSATWRPLDSFKIVTSCYLSLHTQTHTHTPSSSCSNSSIGPDLLPDSLSTTPPDPLRYILLLERQFCFYFYFYLISLFTQFTSPQASTEALKVPQKTLYSHKTQPKSLRGADV